MYILAVSCIGQQAWAEGSGDVTLEGITWRLVSLHGKSVANSPVPSSSLNVHEPQLRFDSHKHRVSGSGGCNRLVGTYRSDKELLSIGPLITTRMACVDSIYETRERDYFKMLDHVVRYDTDNGKLVLYDKLGDAVAVFKKAAIRE